MSLFTNSNNRKDFFSNAFKQYTAKSCDVFIAAAFFTHADTITRLADKGCRVKLIVRLGYPTMPSALKTILNKERVQIRFVNDRSFHPKLYIFMGSCVIVGSSNLTDSALKTNQEVNIAIGTEDSRYDELVSIFSDWWDQAKVLNAERLKEYSEIYDRYRKNADPSDQIEEELQKKQGKAMIKNINRGDAKPSKSEIYLEGYRSDYQGFHDAFMTVERIYKTVGRRHQEDSLPLRLEIDSFFSFLRDKKAQKDSYLHAPLLQGDELESKVKENIEEWLKTPYPWLDDEIVPNRYPVIIKIFGSPESIENATFDELVEALSVCHSFKDAQRFYHGGHDTHVKEFNQKNDLKQIKRTLAYLLFSGGDFISRMGRCIFDPAYKLNEFGRSNVQELLGWVNNENIPICNNRTLRSVRWLGFDVVLTGG
jgi:hypothetical protein